MPDARYRFGPFVLDVQERRLARDGEAVALPSRYFDLLVVLVARAGSLVDKQTLFAEAWPGVIVGDAALSQGIRTVRVALGDDASAPRFVETVAGHGYRFIAPVERLEAAKRVPSLPTAEAALVETGPAAPPPADVAVSASPALRLQPTASSQPSPDSPPAFSLVPRSEVLSRTGAVTGALLAALVGGVLYGLGIGSDGPHAAQTVASVTAMSMAVGGLGAAMVATGARLLERRGSLASLLGAGLGGAAIGLIGEYVGQAVLLMLTGRDVALLTGPAEGFLIGIALAAGPLLVKDRTLAVVTSAALALVVFAGLATTGRPTFIGSLEHTLALPGVPLRLDGLAPGGLTPSLRTLLSAFEGALFGLGFGAGAVVRRDRTLSDDKR